MIQVVIDIKVTLRMMARKIISYFSRRTDIQKKKFGNTDHILVCNSKGLSDESIKSPATSDKNLLPSLNYIGTKKRGKFNVSSLKQDKIIFVDAL